MAVFQLAQERHKDVIERPIRYANRIIRSIKENGWRVAEKRRAGYPRLEDELTAQRVVDAVQSAFEDNVSKPATY